MKKLLAALAAVCLLAGASFAASLEERLAQVSLAIGALYAQNAQGDLKFLCSTTVVGKTDKRVELLTAKHCVEKDVSYLVTFDGRQFYSANIWKLPPELVSPTKYVRPYNQPETDAALFVIDQPLDVPVVPLGDDKALAAGRAIFTVGFPLGAAKISYSGQIAGRYARPGADINGYLILQIFGAPGSSGSAVIEEATGKVVGILVAGRQAFGTPVIFATPISYLPLLRPVTQTGNDER